MACCRLHDSLIASNLPELLCALHWPPAPAPPIRHGCIGSALLWLDVYLFTSTNPNNPSEPAKSTVLLGPLQQMDRLRPSFPSSVAYALLQPTKPLSLPQKTMDIISFAHEAPKRVFVIPSKKNKKKDAGEAAAGEADTSRPQLDVARVAAAEVFDHWAKGSGVQNVEELCNVSAPAFLAPSPHCLTDEVDLIRAQVSQLSWLPNSLETATPIHGP